MAQHDQVIDNGSGLTVRTDFNAAIAALFSNSSGPVEPSVTVAGQFWFDTANASNPVLRQRNLANTGWLTVFQGGQLAIDIATGKRAGPPKDTFVWNDKIDLSGTDVMTLDDTGNLAILGNFQTSGSITGLNVNSTGGMTSGSKLTFSSATAGANGLAFTNADKAIVARKAGTPAGSVDRVVINSKADGSGTDVVEVRNTGVGVQNGICYLPNGSNKVGFRWVTGNLEYDIDDGAARSLLWAAFNCPINKASPGYQKLASGLMVQWGIFAGSATDTLVTFPTAFPTQAAILLGQPFGAPAGNQAFSLTVDNLTAANFAWRPRFIGVGSIAVSAFPGSWFAIGW